MTEAIIVVRDFGDTLLPDKGTLKFVGVNPWNPNAPYLTGPARAYRFIHVWIERTTRGLAMRA